MSVEKLMNKSKPTQDVIEMGKDYLDVVKAAKKQKKPSKTGLGWFTTFRRKEAPAGFEPAMADLQSVGNCESSGGHVASWSA